MNLIESLRARVVTESVTRLGRTWPERRATMFSEIVPQAPVTSSLILGVGNRLSAAFQIGGFDRGQAGVSNAGTQWTEIVCYYLNMVLAGSEAIALPSRYVPRCLKDSLSVTYRGTATSLESDIDLMVIFAPGISALAQVTCTRNGLRDDFSRYAESNFSTLSVTLFQLKTNWNDSAQVPMLWNMIYSLAARGQMPENGFSVGKGQFHLAGLRSFCYAFVTVPTQSNLESFRPSSMPVSRVAGCSGGAYWGRPTKPGVIRSISEYFLHAFNVSRHAFVQPSQLGAVFARHLGAEGRAIGHPQGQFGILAADSPAEEGISLDAFGLY